MTKFHISKDGLPRLCTAKGSCPLGGETPHFETKKMAQDYLDNKHIKEFGFLPVSNFESNFDNAFDEKHKRILNKLDQSGYEAYFVGGSIRDTVLGLPAHDVDITTSATPDQVMEVFSDHQVIPVGLEHGTVVIVDDGEPIEITTFRTDGEYSDGRRPDDVTFTTSLADDVERRDFTINALAYSEKYGLVDHVGGVDDINDKLIRTVGNPDERFKEDPLRIMRGLRFSSKLGFDIEKETEDSIIRNKGLLKNVSVERLQKEFNGLLMGENSKEVLNKYASVIQEFVPEIGTMIGFNQENPHHHLDVWEHSTLVVDNTNVDVAHRLAAIFHDSGKPSTKIWSEDKKRANYLGHAEESVKIAEKALTRLKYDNKTKERVLNIITDHDFQLSTKPYKIKKAIFELGPERFQDMIDFKMADDKSKNLEYYNDLDKYDRVQKITNEYLADKPILSHKDLDIKAKDIMDLGFKGKQVGDALKELSLLVIGGHKNDRESQIEYLLKNGITSS